MPYSAKVAILAANPPLPPMPAPTGINIPDAPPVTNIKPKPTIPTIPPAK